MADRTLTVKFLGDASGLNATISDVQSGAGKISGALGDIGKVAAGFVIGQGITKLPGLLSDAAQSAADDEASTARVQTAVKSLGGDYDDHIAKVNDAITAGQKLGFSDDDTRDSISKLVLATGDQTEALARNKAAMDLARGANIPLSQASLLLGKVTDDNLQVFKRMGITLPDVASEADVLAAVQGKFAGQSDAYAQSTAGQFAIAKDQMAEAQEAIGAGLLPVMAGLATLVSTVLVPALGAVAPLIDGLVSAVQLIADHFNIVAPILAGVAAAILAAMVPAVIAWTVATWAQVAALTAQAIAFAAANAPLIAIVAAVGLVVAAIVLLIQHWGDVQAAMGAVMDFLSGVWSGFTSAATGPMNAVVSFITGTWSTVKDAVTGPISAAVDWFKNNWQTVLIGVLTGPLGLAVQWVAENWGAITSAVTSALQAVLDWLNGAWQAVTGAFSGALEAALGWATGAWTAVTNALTGPLQTALGWLQGAWQASTGAITGAIQGALDTLGEMGGEAWTAVQTIATNIVSGIVDTVTGGWGALRDAIWSMKDSAIAALGNVSDWLWDVGKRIVQGIINGITSAPGALVDAIESLIPGGGIVGGAIDAIGGLFGAASGEWMVPGPRGAGDSVPYLLTPGEMVLPAPLADRVRSATASGAGGSPVSVTMNFYGPTDSKSLREALDQWLEHQFGGGAAQWGVA